MGSAHFQVQERCLYLWSNENLVNRGCLGKQYCSTSLPCIYAPLSKLSKGHWHPTVRWSLQGWHLLQSCAHGFRLLCNVFLNLILVPTILTAHCCCGSLAFLDLAQQLIEGPDLPIQAGVLTLALCH